MYDGLNTYDGLNIWQIASIAETFHLSACRIICFEKWTIPTIIMMTAKI